MQRMRNLSPQTRAKRKAEILTAVYSRSHSVPSLAKLYSLSQNTIYAWIKQQRSQESELSKSSDAVLTQVHVRSSAPTAIQTPTITANSGSGSGSGSGSDSGSASPKFLEVAVAKCQYPESGYLQENDCGRQEQEQKRDDEQPQPLSSPPSIIHKASLSFSSYSFVIKGKIDSARLILILKTLEGSC